MLMAMYQRALANLRSEACFIYLSVEIFSVVQPGPNMARQGRNALEETCWPLCLERGSHWPATMGKCGS